MNDDKQSEEIALFKLKKNIQIYYSIRIKLVLHRPRHMKCVFHIRNHS